MSEVVDNGRAKVLVADDDPAILRLVKAIVEKEGYEVVTARDGKEAYKILQTGEPFVAAIFDVVMPYIQGTELVRYMQSEKRLMKIPVIMMTAEQNSRLSSDSFGRRGRFFAETLYQRPASNNAQNVHRTKLAILTGKKEILKKFLSFVSVSYILVLINFEVSFLFNRFS